MQKRPHSQAAGGQIEPSVKSIAPLTRPAAIGIHISVFSTMATGVRRWNRAITSGIVSNQIVALMSPRCRRLRIAAQTNRAGQDRFAAISRSKDPCASIQWVQTT